MTEELITPYKLIKLLNSRFNTNYPTQLGYNYVRNNLIPSENNRIKISDAEIWIKKFSEKNIINK